MFSIWRVTFIPNEKSCPITLHPCRDVWRLFMVQEVE